MPLTPEESEFIRLANVVRKVRTPAGAAYFGQPIGTIITKDMIEAKKKEKGTGAPKGSLSKQIGGSSNLLSGGGSAAGDSAFPSPKNDGAGLKESSSGTQGPGGGTIASQQPTTSGSTTAIKQIPSTLNGPQKFSVGEKEYGAPTGSVLIKPKGKEGLVYVRDPKGKIHAFNELDEVEIPPTLTKLFETKFGKDFKGDDNYEVLDFEVNKKQQSLDALPEGSELFDDEGNVQFKKQSNGDWVNPQFGAIMTSDELQESYDNGELISTGTASGLPEDEFPDFASMEKEEFDEAISNLPSGFKMFISNIPFVKQEDGSWKSEKDSSKIQSPPFVLRKFFKPNGPSTVKEKYEQDVKTAEAKGEEPPKLPASLKEEEQGAGKIGQSISNIEAKQKKQQNENAVATGSTRIPKKTSGKESESKGNKVKPSDKTFSISDFKTKAGYLKYLKAFLELDKDDENLTETELGLWEEYTDYEESEKAPKKTASDGQNFTTTNPNAPKTEKKPRPEGKVQYSTTEELDALPVGHEIVETWQDDSGDVFIYQKKENGGWQAQNKDGTPGSTWTSSWMISDVEEGKTVLQSLKNPEDDETLSSKRPRIDTTKALSTSDLDVLQPGDAIHLKSPNTNSQFLLIKIEDGQWFDPKDKALYPTDSVKTDIENFDAVVNQYKMKRADFLKKEPGAVVFRVTPDFDVKRFVKQENGTWKPDDSENEFADNAFFSDIADGLVFDELPDEYSEPEEDTPNETEEEDPVIAEIEKAIEEEEEDDKFSYLPSGVDPLGSLTETKVGDQISVYNASGEKKVVLQKQDDGIWQDTKHPTLLWYDSEIQSLLENGQVAKEKSAPLDNDIIEIGNEPIGKTHAESALQALEDHSGFQIKYGLKSLPENSPFKNDNFVESVKKEAQDTYNDLTPKQAFVQLLKDKLGVANPQNIEDSSSPKSLIGSESPKETATGVTGGEFSLDEINEAIDILESFEGKAFKNELNKKGSPLGKLSPNHIVGFNKDKTVTKQKFLDLLKKKAQDLTPSAEESASELKVGDVLSSADQLKNAKVGTVVDNKNDPTISFKKIGPDSWAGAGSDNGGSQYFSSQMSEFAIGGNAVVTSVPGSEDDEVEQAQPAEDIVLPEVGGTPTVADANNAPVGTVYGYDNGGAHEWDKWSVKKKETGDWSDTDTNSDFTSISINSSIQMVPQYWSVISYPEPFAPTPAEEEGFKPGDKITDPETFAALRPGTKVEAGEFDQVYIKQWDGLWHTSTGSTFDDDDFSTLFDQGLVTYYGFEKVDKPLGDKIESLDQLDALPIGSWINAYSNDYKKISFDLWESSNGSTWGTSVFTNPVKTGAVSLVSVPEEENVSQIAASMQPGDKVPSVGVLNALKSGSTISVVSQLSASVLAKYTKNEDGLWLAEDGSPYDSNEFEGAIDNESLEFSGKSFVAALGAEINDMSSLKSLGEGDTISIGVPLGNSKWTKKNGLWVATSTKVTRTDEDIAKFFDTGYGITYVGKEDSTETLSEGDILSWEQFKDLNVGAEVSYFPNSHNYVKQEGDMWLSKILGSTVDSSSFIPALNSQQVKFVKNGEEESNTPNSSKSFDVSVAPVNTVVKSSAGQYYYQKDNDTYWSAYETSTGAFMGTYHNDSVQKWIDSGKASLVGEPKDEKLVPGKYISGTGKVKMWVKPDGTGVYENKNGELSALTAKAVLGTFKVGPNLYYGEEEAPKVGAKTVKAKPAPKPIGDINDLPDGTYYDGNPLAGNTSKYEVKGDEVVLYAAVKSLGGSSKKIGQKPDSTWVSLAPAGAVIDSPYYGDKYIKGDDNKWFFFTDGEKGDEVTSNINYSINNTNWDYAGKKLKIYSMGAALPTKIEKSKLKTKFLKGQLVDEKGTSVLPKNYSGGVSWYGHVSSLPELMAFKKELDEFDSNASPTELNTLHSKHKINVAAVKKNLEADVLNAYGEVTLENKLEWMKTSLSDFLKDLYVEEPENDASDLFEWDGTGHAVMPLDIYLEGVPDYWSTSTGALTKKIQEISSKFGDGDIIGQFATAMTKADKHTWIEMFHVGNFKAMYDLEVEAGAKKGKAHPNGWKHPGFVGNQKTNKIKWGSAVPGEIPAGETVEGNWSSTDIEWSGEEIDNYLIKAQMQYPEYLTSAEKRQWVKYHIYGEHGKQTVDKLSATAKKRALDGEAKLSDTPVWTDNIKPAKSYSVFFDDTDFPVEPWTQYLNLNKAVHFFDDTMKNPSDVQTLGNLTPADAAAKLVSMKTGDQVKRKEKIYTKNDFGTWTTAGIDKEFTSAEVASLPMQVVLMSKVDNDYDTGVDPKELQKFYNEVKLEEPFQTDQFYKPQAVARYFAQKKAEYEAELLKPVYTKKPLQTVKKSTHPVFEYSDQWGNDYFFKPRKNTKLDKYRSEVEHLGNMFGRLFGFKTAKSELITLDGQYGQIQQDVGGVADLAHFDYSTATKDQIADIGSEHILDWFLDNDDTKGDNAKILPDGHIVGIDKGRAFKHFGAWNGLSGDDSMNTNAHTIYSQLYDTIRAGKLSKDDVDAAFQKIRKRALQMSKISDAKITEMLKEGMKNREQWDIKYKIDGKNVPQNLEGLTAAVIDRKNRLPEQIEAMWAKIYKQAGFGDLPEQPQFVLGEEHYSGLGESHFHENAFKVNAGGVAALLGGDFSSTGAAIAWGTTNDDGSKDMFTQIELNHIADQKVYGKLKGMAGDASVGGTADPALFASDEFGGNFTKDYYRAMATLAKHADDKTYNQDRISEYKAAKVRLQKDLDFWTPDLKAGKDGNVMFPSGASVPQEHLGQYRLMLDFYKEKEALMDSVIENTENVFPLEQKAKYQPYQLASKAKLYVKDGESLIELSDGSWLHATKDSVKKISGKEGSQSAETGGWKELEGAPEGKPNYGGAQIHINNSTFETKGKWDNGTGVIHTGKQGVGHWTQGKEYSVQLPTGEFIYFRNETKTNTLKSQYGRLTIKVPNATDASSYAAGLERAQDWINSYLGLDVEGADEKSAELIYWRQMLPILTRRHHKTGTPYQNAFADVQKKAQELGISTDDFGFRFGESTSVDDQISFYRQVWGDHFGHDKVDELVSGQKYLPAAYEATDLANPDVVQGRPVWHRFDLTLADLLSADKEAFVASGSHGGNKTERAKAVAMSGAHLSTEERIRFFGGAEGGSSSSDQSMGTGGQDQFTRVWDNANANGYDFVYHPSVLLHTNTRFFHADAFGQEGYEKDYANPDPLDIWKNHHSNTSSLGGGNQLDIRWGSSWFNSLEMVLFDDIKARDEAIQSLKKLGLEMIRGLPIEDRLVMRQNRAEAINKLRAHWQKEAGL